MSRSGWHALPWLLLLSWPSVASGQVVGGPQALPAAVADRGILTGFRSVVDISYLAGDEADQRYDWDVDASVDFDVFDVGWFRGNTFANFETIIGNELRDIDPNQINYTIDLSVFLRLPRGELATTFHHVSRHLVDRAGERSVSWNMIGASYDDGVDVGRYRLNAGGRAMVTVERADVDYTAEVSGHVTVTRPVSPRVALFGRVAGVVVPVERAVLSRGTQRGGRIAGGVRVTTGASRLEVFVTREHRIDASREAHQAAAWTSVGVRITAPVP